MKKFLFIIYFLIVGYSSMALTVKNINKNLVRVFKEIYPNAVQVSWREYPDTYAVYFSEEAVKVNIIFKKDGTFLSSTRYYKDEYLPYYLVAFIKEKYREKKIYSVTEISSPSNIDYYIKLEDEKNWMTVKLDSYGNMSVVEKFKKAP